MRVETKRKLVILLILTVSIIGMVGLTKMRPVPPKKPIKDTSLLIDVLELQPMEITFEVRSQGTVRPRTETVLSSEVSGRVISISDKFIAGGVFAAGEILMKIDATDYQVSVDQAEALLKQRQIEFNGAKSLSTKGYRADAELAAAQAALAAAKASLTKAKKNLDRTHIRLPYDGLVKSKNADIGQYVNPGSHLGTTYAIDIVEVRLALTDHDLAFVDLPATGNRNQSASYNAPKVQLSAIQKGKLQQWKAQIIRTEGVVDEKSRVTYVVAQITDPYLLSTEAASENETPLPIGTFVNAVIKGNRVKDLVKVPRTAIRGKNELMFIDKENRLQLRKVTIIRADSKYAYVQQGATAGDRISITAIESPINGMKVRTVDDPLETEQAAVDTQFVQGK